MSDEVIRQGLEWAREADHWRAEADRLKVQAGHLRQDLEVTEARLVAQREGYERRLMASIQAVDQVHTSLHTAMRQVSAHERGLTRGCPQCESRFLDGQELAEPERAEL